MIRNDFVSNSSSSSFIIGNSFFTNHFKITAKDFKNALMYLGIDKLDYDFCDTKNKKESSRVFKIWDELLEQWWADTKPHDIGSIDGSDYDRFIKLITILADTYGYISDYEFMQAYNTGNKAKDPKERLPSELYKILLKAKEKYHVFTMKEVAHCENAIFFCHMSDNEIWELDGASIYSVDQCYDNDGKIKDYIDKKEIKKAKKYNFETDDYTFERILELIVRYWVFTKRVDLNDPEFIDFWKVPDNHWWKREKKYKDRKYFFKGKKPSFDDILETFCWAANTHEG